MISLDKRSSNNAEVFVMTSRALQIVNEETNNKDLSLDFKAHKDLSPWA